MTLSDRAAELSAMSHDALVLLAMAKERECAELRSGLQIAHRVSLQAIKDKSRDIYDWMADMETIEIATTDALRK